MKNTMVRTIGTLALMAITSISASAAEETWQEEGFANRFYIGVGAGASKVDLQSGARNEEGIDFVFEETNDSDISTSVMVGWRLNHIFSVEAGYLNLGSVDQTFSFSDPRDGDTGTGILTVSPEGYYGGVLLTHNFGLLQVFGRAGAYMWDYDMETRFDVDTEDGAVSERAKLTRDGSSMIYGVGLRYRATELWSVGADVNWTDVDGDNITTYGIALFWDIGTEAVGI